MYLCVRLALFLRVHWQFVAGCSCSCTSWLSIAAVVWLYTRIYVPFLFAAFTSVGVVPADFFTYPFFSKDTSYSRAAFFLRSLVLGSSVSRGITTFDLIENLRLWCF